MDKPPFDELKQLAEDSPAAFEELRTELVEDLIRNSDRSSQKRLRGLQFVIDSRRDLAGNPVKAMIEIQSMMHASLERLNRALQSLGQDAAEPQHSLTSRPAPDNVVLFSRAQHH
jgi:hypothetical protein